MSGTRLMEAAAWLQFQERLARHIALQTTVTTVSTVQVKGRIYLPGFIANTVTVFWGISTEIEQNAPLDQLR